MSNWRIDSWAMMIAAAALTAACHHQASSRSPVLSIDRLGVYQFSEHATAGGDTPETLDIEGTVVVLADTVAVEARPGPCIPSTPSVSSTSYAYTCGNNLSLSFDRRDPIRRATYFTRLAHNVKRQVCARYAMVNGRQTSSCAEFRTETSQEYVNRSGVLRLMRAPE